MKRAAGLDHLFSYSVTLQGPPEVIGPVPEGVRVNFYVTGGEVTGPRIHGRLRPVGGDWLTLRRDGIGMLDVRATLETHDGAVVDVSYRGSGDLGLDGYESFLLDSCRSRLRYARRRRCARLIRIISGSIASSPWRWAKSTSSAW